MYQCVQGKNSNNHIDDSNITNNNNNNKIVIIATTVVIIIITLLFLIILINNNINSYGNVSKNQVISLRKRFLRLCLKVFKACIHYFH